jgi:hypothetical protein
MSKARQRRASPAADPRAYDSSSTVTASPWLTPKEAAGYLKVKPNTLAKWRVAGHGPQYSKRTGVVLYHVNDLDAWVRGGLRPSTTNPPEQLAS